MISRTLATAALLSVLSLATAARSENLEQTRQLLASKQCPKCELSGAGLVLANLAGANLGGANLNRANLSRADLTRANLSGADLSSAGLFGANLGQANLKGANLAGADLRDANLAGADLTGVNLAGANVKGAIGLGEYVGRLENLYQWAMEEGQRKNYPRAIEYFNQALTLKPDFAPAFLGRAAAKAEMGNYTGGLQDAQQAETLYSAQGDPNGYQTSQVLIKQIEVYQKRARGEGGASSGNLLNVLGGLLLRVFF
ncbi:pentapeptide repeat-containing protein [Microcoleus sp. FACHB-672]|uniref:pentapeptide repeat-containing protein n=1 Tax=Microcoleus sp. FACHB-672 TaxID=2692825 RepID=UPI001F54F7EB|nr:pentapeptide repeat-containing protein [Microcoleus sp. FACHB-672]